MTDTNTLAPTDAELMQVIQEATRNLAFNRPVSTSLRIAHAVLAKWGTPAPASSEPTPQQISDYLNGLDAINRAAVEREAFGGEPTLITLTVGKRHGGEGVYACYTDFQEEGTTFLGVSDEAAIPQPAALALDARELRSILQDVTSVAITMLYASHKTDVLAEFNLAELTAVSTASDGLQPSAVEKIYRRGFDAAIAAQQGGA